MAVWSDNVRIFDSSVECGILTHEQGEQMKSCYTALRNRLHHLNLLNQESCVESTEFVNERQLVSNIWNELFLIQGE